MSYMKVLWKSQNDDVQIKTGNTTDLYHHLRKYHPSKHTESMKMWARVKFFTFRGHSIYSFITKCTLNRATSVQLNLYIELLYSSCHIPNFD